MYSRELLGLRVLFSPHVDMLWRLSFLLRFFRRPIVGDMLVGMLGDMLTA